MTPTTVLVTGGAGYIGSHTVRALLERGHRPVVLDTLELGIAASVAGCPLVEGDAGDRRLVRALVREHGVEAVIHLAGYKNPGESMADPARYFEGNIGVTQRLLDALQGTPAARVVFSSSCSVYGTPASVPVTEAHDVHPESVYGETKLIAERLLHWYATTGPLRYVSLRYFNAAGASHSWPIGEDWSVTQNLVPLAIKATLGQRPPLEVFGGDYPTPDGTAIRDFVHVDDLARAHVLAIDHLAAGGAPATVNLGTGRGASVLEVLDVIEAVSGRTVPHRIVERRPGDPVALFADCRAAAQVLGWHARHDLEDIIRTAWRWHSRSVG